MTPKELLPTISEDKGSKLKPPKPREPQSIPSGFKD
jgi:hypothetical protein